jgi:hypothetical protein
MEGDPMTHGNLAGSSPTSSGVVWLLALVTLALLAVLTPMRAWLPVAAQSTAEARSVRFALGEANGSGLEARVKLIDLGGQTRVVVAIRGVDVGEFLPHIHSGQCTDYDGTPRFPLALFSADERSRTTVDLDYDTFLSGGYLIDIHPLATSVDDLFNPATAVVCGHVRPPEGAPEQSSTTPTPANDELIVITGPSAGAGPVPDQHSGTILVALLALLALAVAWTGFDLRRRTMLTVAQRRLMQITGRKL